MSDTVERPYKQSRASRGILPAVRARGRAVLRRAFRTAAVLALAVIAAAALSERPAQAQTPQNVAPGWQYIPTGVSEGQSFRLLFVTSSQTTTSSASISTYNSYVQARAAANTHLAGFSGQFRAFISTATVDARDNTGTAPAGTSYTANEGVPIYWLGGAKVADDYADFYDGSWDSRAGKTETGGSYTTGVWTGSDADGTRHAFHFPGSVGGVGRIGSLSLAGKAINWNFAFGISTYPLYALSPVITVRTPPPKVSLSLGTTRIDESGSNNATTVKATLSKAVSSAVTVTLSASPPNTVVLGSTTLTIPSGGTESGTVTVTAVDNSESAPDARVTISGSVSVTGVDAPDPATLTVTDDDTIIIGPPPPSGANKLVGNAGQPASAHPVTFKYDAAQWFRTGRHPGGYRLTHVDIWIKDGSSTTPSYTVKIHAPQSTVPYSTGSGLPGEALGTLTNPGSLPKGGGFVRFAASGNGVDLAARSNYFVVIDVGGSGDRKVVISTAASSALDRDGVAEWGFHDVSWKRLAGSTGSWLKKGPSPRLQMAVYGTAKAAPPPAPEKVPSGAIWSASLTVDYMGGGWPYYGCGHWNAGFVKCAVVLSDDDFVHGGVTYRIHALEWNAREKRLGLDLGPDHDASVLTTLGSLTLHVDGRTFAFSDARFNGAEGIHWPFDGPWREGQRVSLALTDSGTPSSAPEPAAPALQWARVTGAELALRFDSGLDETSLPAAGAFSVSVAGAPRAVSSVSVSQDLVTLTLAEPVSAGEAVTVGYAPPAGEPGLRLAGGGAAVAAFAGYAVANDTPAGEPQQASPPGAVDPLTARFTDAPAGHQGDGEFALRVAFSAAVAARAKDAGVQVSGGTLTRAVRVNKRKDLWKLTVQPSGYGAVTMTLPATADCAAAGAVCTADGRKLETALTHTVQGPVTISVADARAKEAAAATVDFAVTLSRAASGKVTVRYATRNGTAKKGKDYRNAKGKLTFAAGETAKTVSVAVLDDAKDEGEETFRLVLYQAKGAVIADGEATGTIENSDSMPRAWLARFGRTVASQAMDAVKERLEGGAASTRVTLGGHEVLLDADAAAEGTFGALPASLEAGGGSGPAPPGWRAGLEGQEPGTPLREVSARELLLGSSFHLASAGGGGGNGSGRWSLWGRVATGGFDGDADGLALDGDVTTGFLGADAAGGNWLSGVALGLSEGEGAYRDHAVEVDHPDRGSGEVESALTSVFPYARVRLSERVTAWAVLGWGTGELTLTEKGERPVETDLSMRMGAVGGRGTLVPATGGGFALALRTDAFWVRTESDPVRSEAGNLAASEADASRLRLVLEASRTFEAAGGELTPGVEIGLRHDGGDAETGTGVELGAGVRYARAGVSVEARVRWLAAHEAGGYEEWGASATVRIGPDDSGRGLSLALAPAVGSASGGTERLWSAADARGIAPGAAFDPERRLEAEVGYGLDAWGGLLTPYGGLSATDGGQTWRAGARFELGERLTMRLEGDLRRSELEEDGPVGGVRLEGSLRW